MPSPYFDKRLLDLMACPACRGPLELSEGMVNVGVPAGLVNFGAPAGLVCRACSLVYPVRDSIPVLLPEEASRYNERLK
ncbi:MAG: Trm112 family protein [Deltaproteobacteria bacterium]|nr:Trm112 family protein [Deltaproteobacteria bacterium]